jgi:acyl-CoA synthetase (AMP-forming)/AMP-acid ligase II
MSDAAPRPRSGTLGDLLDEIAAATPDAPAVVFRAERLDYAGLKARADGFARALLAAGVRRGDRMGLRGSGVGTAAAAQRAVRPENICYILYTSGSTAAPKGVTLAHGPLIANGFNIGERMRLTAADRVWLGCRCSGRSGRPMLCRR